MLTLHSGPIGPHDWCCGDIPLRVLCPLRDHTGVVDFKVGHCSQQPKGKAASSSLYRSAHL